MVCKWNVSYWLHRVGRLAFPGVSFLQLCCPAFYVFLHLPVHYILTLCTKIREVVGLSIPHLPSVLNRSSHLIKPLQCYRVDINMPISPVKKLRHGGAKGVTQASPSGSKVSIWASDTHSSCHWTCHTPSPPEPSCQSPPQAFCSTVGQGHPKSTSHPFRWAWSFEVPPSCLRHKLARHHSWPWDVATDSNKATFPDGSR